MKKLSGLRKLELHKLLLHDRAFLDQGIKSLAGVDEVGRGPLAGPVVASAVIVRDFVFSATIDDSKRLSAAGRLAAFDEIHQKALVGVGIVDHQTVDRINIFEATKLAMQKALLALPQAPDFILIDGPHTLKDFLNQKAIVGGDSKSFSIACASIVAKVTRDRMMEDFDLAYPEYGFAKHKGYGTKTHLEAINKNGACLIHRKSFEPIKSLVENKTSVN